MLQVVIACLLNGSVDVSRLKMGKPARPTHHSRTSSLSSDLDMPLASGLLRTPSRTNSLTASDYESVDLPSDPKASPRSVSVNAVSPREVRHHYMTLFLCRPYVNVYLGRFLFWLLSRTSLLQVQSLECSCFPYSHPLM